MTPLRLYSWIHGPPTACPSPRPRSTEARDHPAQAIVASDYHLRPNWAHVAISRSGTTTEIVEAMQRARGVEARVILIGGDSGTPAKEGADAVFRLEFAAGHGVDHLVTPTCSRRS